MSSAGNTRGLIEAPRLTYPSVSRPGLPRGIPAASLKQIVSRNADDVVARLPRGIPAASLKRGVMGPEVACALRLPRGIPAASLKRDDVRVE